MELLKLSIKDIRQTVEIALQNRNKECFCSVQETHNINELFPLPMENVEAVDNMEEMLNNVNHQQKLVIKKEETCDNLLT